MSEYNFDNSSNFTAIMDQITNIPQENKLGEDLISTIISNKEKIQINENNLHFINNNNQSSWTRSHSIFNLLDKPNFILKEDIDMMKMSFNSSPYLFDISNSVTNDIRIMNRIYSYCENIKGLHLLNYNAEKVRDMPCAFSHFVMENYQDLNLANFDQSEVTNLETTFNCRKYEKKYSDKKERRIKNNIRKTYKNKKEKRNVKKFFVIIYNQELVKGNRNNKVGYDTTKKSGRKLNIKDKIERDIIQGLIRNWINYNENDFNKIIQKLNPSVIKNNKQIKNKTLEEIFKLDITKKNNIDEKHNIEIINNIDDNDKRKIKLKFAYIEIIKIIDNEKLFYEGLNIKEYLEGITGSERYKKKYKKCFMEFIKNTLNSE